jgi:pimeloyl-ACP methyl ester carboxylesterase
MKPLVTVSLGSGWIRLYPESVENIPNLQQAKARLSCDAMKNQMNVGFAWEATNWNGVCIYFALAKITKPTLVITGTADNDSACQFFSYCRKNSCLVQIRDAGHAVSSVSRYNHESIRNILFDYSPIQLMTTNVHAQISCIT